MRYTPSGGLDSGFDADGKVTTAFEASTTDRAFALALQADGKLLAGGISAGNFAAARYRVSSGLEERSYAQQDANWNVTSTADVFGAVLERYGYEPYGAVTILEGDWSADGDNVSDVGMVYLHQGGRYEAFSGLYHFRSRDYSPSLGRWMQQDPLGYADGMSLYEAYRSSPSVFVDPMGLEGVSPSDATRSAQQPTPPLQAPATPPSIRGRYEPGLGFIPDPGPTPAPPTRIAGRYVPGAGFIPDPAPTPAPPVLVPGGYVPGVGFTPDPAPAPAPPVPPTVSRPTTVGNILTPGFPVVGNTLNKGEKLLIAGIANGCAQIGATLGEAAIFVFRADWEGRRNLWSETQSSFNGIYKDIWGVKKAPTTQPASEEE